MLSSRFFGGIYATIVKEGIPPFGQMKKSKKRSTNQIEAFYSKLPPLPKSLRIVLFKIMPAILVIVGGVGLFFALKSLGQYTFFKPYIDLEQQTLVIGVAYSILSVISSVLFLSAFLSISKHKKSTWGLIFFAILVAFASNLLNGDILGLLLPVAAFYLLFQVKSYFK